MLNSVRFFSGLLKHVNGSIADSSKPLYQIKWWVKRQFCLEIFIVIFFLSSLQVFKCCRALDTSQWTINNLFN